MADAANAHLLPTLRKMWASGGLLGLWRGNLASVAKVMPQSAIQFAVRPLPSESCTPSEWQRNWQLQSIRNQAFVWIEAMPGTWWR